METNQYATESNTSVWYEVQRQSGSNYGWITLSDHDTSEQAESAMDARTGSVADPSYRIRRVRGQA
jgi:hypothetical protein